MRRNYFPRISATLATFLLLSTYAGSGAYAQGPATQTMTTEDFRKQAPPALPPRPINLPKPVESTLPNGMKLVIVADKRLPLVSYRLAFPGGTASDPSGQSGLTDMMATMLTEGTTSRTGQQIADEVARLGASLSADANVDYTSLAAGSLAIYGNDILRLLADVAMHPAFPEADLNRNKASATQGLQFQRSQPDFLRGERIAKAVYGPAAYGQDATPASLAAITRDRLQAEHSLKFVPNRATLIVVGNVDAAAVKKQIETAFGGWANPALSVSVQLGNAATGAPKRTARTIYLVDRPGSPQSSIAIANLAIKRTDPDYYALLVMNQVLGAGASARLFMNLREAKGYTYGAYSNLDLRRDAGTFQATSDVRTPVTGGALKEFFYELDRVRNEPVSAKELTDAKAYLTGVFPLQLETQEGLINTLLRVRMMGLPNDYLDTYRDKVNAITAADIQRVAKQYVTPDTAAIAIVGDASAIMDQIKPYAATIEQYDTDGNRVTPGGSAATTDGPVSFPGVWNLSIAAPGQSLPATLTLKEEGDVMTGKVESQLGPGTITDIVITGNKFEGTLTFNMQGQNLAMKVNGSVAGDTIKGSIVPNFPGVPPFTFSGTRKAQ